jgi:hypothetical protein
MTPDPSVTDVLAQIAVATLGFAGTVFLAWIRAHVRNQQAAEVLGNAVRNSVGAAQRAAEKGIREYGTDGRLVGVPEDMRAALQYVLDHAGGEMDRLGITPEAVVKKIDARIGLMNVESNVATAASPAPTQPPLAPVPAAVPMPPEPIPVQVVGVIKP